MPIELIVSATGELNSIFILPESIAHNGRERPVLLNEELKADIEAYLRLLLKYGINSMPHKAYLGFDPNAALVVNEQFQAYKLQSRGKSTNKPRIIPQQLNDHLDSLIDNAGLKDVGITRKSLLRGFVIEAYRNNWTAKEVALVAGMSVENVGNILTLDLEQYAPLSDYFEGRERRKQQSIERLARVRKWTFHDDDDNNIVGS
ncbi:hypothetical protein LRP52_40405 [Photobacterium sp. ZSDE20]|uniref:Uncharacterized protein n=1 Tax=Photobacterium pectinilyticum TaxID=2906793 RepID=A0ABT1N7M4_9GAMM|nr:hypothetical protein [Photobacterium sp. ZSDE20]MCQ1060756.1 hypothetical protein [Photobacterium sp. ZSDE20]MDD1828445.1 hypothetical protein [Photobacterium sp. ZSDE20]